MRSILFVLLALALALALYSCGDSEADKLKAKLSERIEAPMPAGGMTQAVVAQYRDIELGYNIQHVASIKATLERSFEKQLEEFDDKELGFLASLWRKLRYIFPSRQAFEDELRVKASRYFNSLDIAAAVQECYAPYIRDVSTLRGNFRGKQQRLPDAAELSLPEQGGSTWGTLWGIRRGISY